VVLGTLGWAVAKLVAGHATRRRGRATLLVAIAVSLATLVWLGTPFAGALMGWFLD
jgi:hypothetical protein